MFSNNNFSKIKVDAASAFTAVCAYHPFRTLATRAMAGMSMTLNPRCLYAGFFPAVAGSHQLFLISSVYQRCNGGKESPVAACLAGIASAPSVTVFDAWACRKQTNRVVQHGAIKPFFRGLVPTVFRQVGLAFGMFIFPSHLHQSSLGAFAGGAASALITHYPDTVRVVMQTNGEVKIKEACQIAFTRMFSRAGALSCAMRINVLAVAFTVMHFSKMHYQKIFTHQE